MADLAVTAINYALLARLQTFAEAQVPVLPVAFPNVAFDADMATRDAIWIKADILPATTDALAVGWGGTRRHYGFMQATVMHAVGSGEMNASRMAAKIAAEFAAGTKLTRDGFTITIFRPPYLSPAFRARDDVFRSLPVSIPYECFTINP